MKPLYADYDRSVALAAQHSPEQNQCYRNCFDIITTRGWRDLLYVEGFLLVGGAVPLEHGWLMDAEGTVLEPTLVVTRTYTRENVGQCVYFPGHRYTLRQLLQGLENDPSLPLFYQYGWGGNRSALHVQAQVAAHVHMGMSEEEAKAFICGDVAYFMELMDEVKHEQ